MRVEYWIRSGQAYIRITMTPKSDNLTWQSDYAREFARTSGFTLSFGPVDAGGMYMVTMVGRQSAAPTKKRMRRDDCVAATKQLRGRPNCLW